MRLSPVGLVKMESVFGGNGTCKCACGRGSALKGAKASGTDEGAAWLWQRCEAHPRSAGAGGQQVLGKEVLP